uniref:Secreted protein n=1 Tax=Syphacia muris TaxID=451379 RepID=A0A0N5AXZ7_9BILA
MQFRRCLSQCTQCLSCLPMSECVCVGRHCINTAKRSRRGCLFVFLCAQQRLMPPQLRPLLIAAKAVASDCRRFNDLRHCRNYN